MALAALDPVEFLWFAMTFLKDSFFFADLLSPQQDEKVVKSGGGLGGKEETAGDGDMDEDEDEVLSASVSAATAGGTTGFSKISPRWATRVSICIQIFDEKCRPED